jgi:anti-sigma regulatory factor (Ser/Thr protein kinase)
VSTIATDGTSGSHTAFLYRHAHEFTDAAALLAEANYRAGEAMLVLATNPLLDNLRPRLARYGSAITVAELTSLGTDPGRVLAMIRKFVSDLRGRPARCVQEVGWPGRHEEELAEAIRYEALVSMALAGSNASLICGYQTQINDDCLASAQAVHPAIIQGGRVHAVSIPNGSLGGRLPAEALSSPPSWATAFTFRDDQAKVRRFAVEQARRAGLPDSRIIDVQIAVAELAANTFNHTSGPGTLTVWTQGEEIVCQVSDTGHITDPLAGTFRPDPAAPGNNRGLWLVHQVADLVQVRTGPSGTTVRVHLRLPPVAR